MEWFLNADETRETLEFLYQEWLGQLAKKLTSEEMGAKDFLAAGRVIAELAAKFPTKTNEKFQDEDISKMSPEALRQFISARGVTVVPQKAIEAQVTDTPQMNEEVNSVDDLMKKHNSP